MVLSTFSASQAYSQAASGSAAAAAAAETSTQGSAQALGHTQQAATSQSASTAANATSSATRNHVAGTANEASAATGQIRNSGAAATQASNVSAELTQKINSKNAHVGDQVMARTTSSAKLAEGTKLPKGTRLLGKVTEVEPKSGQQHDGHLAFAFDRAVLRDGREIPIHAALQSISAPANADEMVSSADDFGAGAPPVALGVGGRGSGGLLGGGGVGVPHSGLLSGATSTVTAAPARLTSTAGSAAHTTGATLHQTAGEVGQRAGSTFASVSNLPGLTASSSASNSSILDAKGSNVELSSGTQMTLTAAAQ